MNNNGGTNKPLILSQNTTIQAATLSQSISLSILVACSLFHHACLARIFLLLYTVLDLQFNPLVPVWLFLKYLLFLNINLVFKNRSSSLVTKKTSSSTLLHPFLVSIVLTFYHLSQYIRFLL
ncbi:hypothetical protein PIB30_009307 [Stylosanthes scabra]|uniref:Uncharacterized protein n=1 Tax=Stylosanthes scabra TaxID=79078 RepID=A0ABU6T519_9FABA|nr:hypothetical protein [Stylosanthes scabra]